MKIVLSMEVSRRIYACILMCVVAASATSFPPSSSSSTSMSVGESKTFLHGLKSQCPVSIPLSSFPIPALGKVSLTCDTTDPGNLVPLSFEDGKGEWLMLKQTYTHMDGESFDRAMSSNQETVYTAILFYASWCPFSSIFQSRFAVLSSMHPQIKHVMIEQSSAMPSVFSRYGIHSVPSLLIVNQTARIKYHGRKDLHSLVNFYKRTTGLDPVVEMSEDKINSSENDQKVLQLWCGSSLKDTFSREPYLVLSLVFVLSRAFLYFFPEIVSRAMALWLAHIPHLNTGIFGESRQLLGRVFQLIDIKRIWSKLKLCKTRNFHRGAINARVWASSLASVSLGESASTRAFPSRDL